MMRSLSKMRSLVGAIGLAAMPLIATAEMGPTILTIAGSDVEANRPDFQEDSDVVFRYLGLDFDKAYAFDQAALAALDQQEVVTPFPVTGGPETSLVGPKLADVVAQAGVAPADQLVRLTAIDGYTIEQSLTDMIEWGAVLATHKDGEPIGLGDYGPVMVVFPPSEAPTPATENADLWVWSVIYMELVDAE